MLSLWFVWGKPEGLFGVLSCYRRRVSFMVDGKPLLPPEPKPVLPQFAEETPVPRSLMDEAGLHG